jgi:hypothetical protein
MMKCAHFLFDLVAVASVLGALYILVANLATIPGLILTVSEILK